MLLRKEYAKDDAGELELDDDGNPTVTHLTILEAPDVGGAHHFSPRLVERGIADGWLGVGGGEFTVKTAKGKADLVFKIVEPPGTFCAHCGERMSSSPDALAHIAAEHDGEDSPDAQNPSGYRVDNYYRTERAS